MKSQGTLFPGLPPPGEKPIKFIRPQHPIWTENKAKLIERYLYYFVLITRHGAYIDGFAAPQQAGKPDSWAAKLVLESKPTFLRDFWLCDINARGVRQLEALVESQPKIRGRRIQVVKGDFNVTVESLLKGGGIAEKTATFCLLDQRTFQCEWKTLQTLAKHKSTRKIELFYFLATGWLDRAMHATTKNTDRIERWWGSSDWTQLRGMKSRDRADRFCERMKNELGYKHAHPWEIYSRETGGTVMYHMIHASDHDEAPVLMSRAYRTATSNRESLKRLQREMADLIDMPLMRRPDRA